MLTYSKALREACEKIGQVNAARLVEHITGQNLAGLYLHPDCVMTCEEQEAFLAACERVVRGEPLQYVLGVWDFCGIALKVDARALIPRPETEQLAQMVLEHILLKRGRLQVCDMCTGSGCIAVYLAPHADVTACDLSSDALSLAHENIEAHGLDVRLIESDLFAQVQGKFDIIVSNPPYITTDEYMLLDSVILMHEPRMAFDGGADGLEIYRRLIEQAKSHLSPGGRIFLETGPAGVHELLRDAGFCDIQMHRDLAGFTRIITAALC